MIEDKTEALIPIDTTILKEKSIEDQQKIQRIMDETYVLSNRLNQLRYKMRQTDREKLEIETIGKEIERLTKELNEIEQGKSNSFGWKRLFNFKKK